MRFQSRKNLLSESANDVGYGSHGHYPVHDTNVHRYFRVTANFDVHFRLFERRRIEPTEVDAHRSVCHETASLWDGCHLCQRYSTSGGSCNKVGYSSTQKHEFSVLVSVVEFPQYSERMEFRVESVVGAPIRLQLLDQGNRWILQAHNGSLETRPSIVVSTDELAGRIFCPNVNIVERETRVPAKPAGPHRDENVVEGCPEIVNDVTQNQGQARVGLLGNFEYVLPAAYIATSIWLMNCSIRLLCFVTPYASVEVLEVMLRPLNLEPPGVSHATP